MIKSFFQITGFLCLFGSFSAEAFFSRVGTLPAVRVVIAQDTNATVAFQPQPEKVRELFNRGFLEFTGKTNIGQAWKSLVLTNDIVGIKVFSSPGHRSGTRPAVIEPIVQGLLEAGVAPQNIVIWDKDLSDLRRAGFGELAGRHQITLASGAERGYDAEDFYESPLIGNLVWGDLEFGKKESGLGRKSFVTKLVSQTLTKIISVAPLLNHNFAETTGHLYSVAMGAVDNTQRFERADRLATAVPELYAMPSVGDKVVLNITDGLIAQYQGEQRTLLHYSTALNQIWFSKDPVALDVLAIQELNRQRELTKVPSLKTNWEIYKNASLLELGVSEPKSISIEMAP